MDRIPPKGEAVYPFKLGYRFKDWKAYASVHDVYRFLQWQLLFEKRVHFLDQNGNLVDVKDNSHWEKDHLNPLKEILKTSENSELTIGVWSLVRP